MLRAELTADLGGFRLEASLAAEAGRPLVLVGESGAGKTTILDLVAGLRMPDRGRVELDGASLFDSEAGIAIPAHARPIGYVFQDYRLFPHLSVAENVAFGLRASGVARLERRRRVDAILDQLGLAPLAGRRPDELSGGQRQRAAVARALVLEPRVLLLDEPLSALDPKTRRETRRELRRLLDRLTGITMLVTHSPFEAMLFGDTIAVVDEGRVIQSGAREDLLRHPASPYVAELMALNFWACRVTERSADGLATVETAGGSLRAAIDAPIGDEVFVAVDPREVALHRSEPEGSEQNVLRGLVAEIAPEPPDGLRVRIALDTRPTLVAEVTERARRSLALAVGEEVYATFKAAVTREESVRLR